MQQPRHLPDAAVQRPWRVGTVPEVSAGEARGPLWHTPHRGVRTWALGDTTSARARALAASVALHGAPLAGWAAAHLLGAADLDGERRDGSPLPVLFAPGASGRIARRDDLVPLRSALDDEDVVVADGVCVTSPVRTAFDLARTARTLSAAVAAVDAVLRARDDLTAEDLAVYAAQRPRWKGVARAREAARLADRRSRSRPESWLRVVWVVDAGLPVPEVNVPVRSAQGHLLGVPDLLDPVSGLVGEYDGEHHRGAEQQHADSVRAEGMEVAGLVLRRASARDLDDARPLVRRLRAGHELALASPRRRWFVAPSELALR